VAFVVLVAVVQAPPVLEDTTRDFFMARNCLAGLPCDRGPPTSVGAFVQGALWTRMLAFTRSLGFGALGVQRAVLALHALSGGAVVVFARRYISLTPAIAAGAGYLVLGAVATGVPRLWNPSLTPLPLALFCGALCLLVESGTIASVLATAVLLAFAADCHLVLIELVPVFLAATLGCARRPALGAATGLCAMAGVLLLDSREAWRMNARALTSSGAWVPVVLALSVAALGGIVFRRRLERWGPAARVVVFLGAATSIAIGTVTARWGAGGTWETRYMVPALPGLAFLTAIAAAALHSLARALRVHERGVAFVAGAAALAIACRALAIDTGGPDWSMVEAQQASALLYRRFASYPALRAHLETRSRALSTAMALFEPRPVMPGASLGLEPPEAIFLFKAPKARGVPAGPWIASLDLGRSVAMVGSVVPFLDRSHIRACYWPLGEARAMGAGGCIDTGVRPVADMPPAGVTDPAYPDLPGTREAFPLERLQSFGGVHESFTVRLSPSAGQSRWIRILADWQAEGRGAMGWAIEEVSGLPHRGSLPALSVTVEGAPGDGSLVIGRRLPSGEEANADYWPPSVVEIDATDVALAEAIDAGWLR
jgi:hypothetical protein